MAINRSITPAQRFGVWKAGKGVCFWCQEPVLFDACHIDHVIPLSAVSNDDDFATVIELYGLGPAFDFDSYYNWVPAHNSCNQRKSFNLPDPIPAFIFFLQTVRRTAPIAEEIALTTERDAKYANLRAKIETAFSKGDVSEADLRSLLAAPLSETNSRIAVERTLQREWDTEVGVVADLTAASVVPDGSGVNRLQQALDTLGADDVDIRRRILGSCVWLDPMPIVRGFNLLREKGHDDPAINSNLDRLKNQGFVQVTSAHILPKDREVCQEAADLLADEFIDLLRVQ